MYIKGYGANSYILTMCMYVCMYMYERIRIT